MKILSAGSNFYTELMCMENMAMTMMQMCKSHACLSMLAALTGRSAALEHTECRKCS